MIHVACCSFGKDSLAQIIVAKQHNEPIDLVVYSEVMFTDDISGEFPEHRDFIYDVAIPKLEKLYGLKTVVLRSDKTMWDDFHTLRVRGESTGKLRGFPIPGLCNINRDCKVPPMRNYLKSLGDDVVQYIGIASDEEKRLARLDGVKQISLLAKYGITEAMATDICRDAGLLSPIYEFTKRNGCFFCPNSSISELRYLYHNHPELWLTLREMQETPNVSRNCFTRNKTIFEYEEQFREEERMKPVTVKQFLYDYQYDAVDRMCNGCILNGGTGSGKSRTGLYYYFKQNGGSYIGQRYVRMKNPKDLYIITTAMKRDKKEWLGELANYRMCPDPELNLYSNKIVIDSWNNIKKYKDVQNAFFIFDEDRVTGYGAWVKAFLKIAKKNEWIILSATPGDTWQDYIPVFIANGFYRNKTEFSDEHIVYNPRVKFPKVDRYLNTGRLIRLRDKILIDMDFNRPTVQHHEDVYTTYNIAKYKDAIRNRWDPYKNVPMKQASELCYILRRIVNEDESRQTQLLQLLENHPKAIIFYNFDYELEILKNLYYGEDVEIAEWNGHAHQPIPTSDKWVYLVNYNAGAEGWNCITTDTIIFYSQNYSYKTMTQAAGRIDRINTKFVNLYYYHIKSRSGIDLAISKALREKRKFNETRWTTKMHFIKSGSDRLAA